jgi:hypothetical protein
MNIVGYLVQKFSGNKIRPKIKVAILMPFLIFMDFQKVDGQTLRFPYTIANVHAGGTTTSSSMISGYAQEDQIKLEIFEIITGSEEHKIDVTELDQIHSLADGSFYFKNLITGLRSDTQYRYQFILADTLYDIGGQFRTFENGPFSFSMVFGSCSYTGSERKVFDNLANEEAICYLNVGDLHYENIGYLESGDSVCTQRFETAYFESLNAQRQVQLYRSTSFAYMWDDHDFGPNNSAGHPDNDMNEGDGKNAGLGTAPCTEVSKAVYDKVISHYPLTDSITSFSQSFNIGRIRVLLTDLRSNKLRPVVIDCETVKEGSNFGSTEHLNWFKDQVINAKNNQELLLWVSSFPFINAPGGPDYSCNEDDDWGGYINERKEVSNFINKYDVPLIIVSGDAHMLAIDSGTNSNYSDEGEGFPVFHVGALDQRGSIKGGPYDMGVKAGGGQYGKLEINDDGKTIEINFQGKNELNEIVVSNKGYPLNFNRKYFLPKKLSKPSDLSVETISRKTIKISWNDNAINESGYSIEKSPLNIDSLFTEIAVVGTNKTDVIDTLLDSNSIWYRVRAIDTLFKASDFSDPIKFTPAPLGFNEINNQSKLFKLSVDDMQIHVKILEPDLIETPLLFVIYNMSGKILTRLETENTAEIVTIKKPFYKGVYFITISTPNNFQTQKFFFQ